MNRRWDSVAYTRKQKAVPSCDGTAFESTQALACDYKIPNYYGTSTRTR
jgi:hypothetical protein